MQIREISEVFEQGFWSTWIQLDTIAKGTGR